MSNALPTEKPTYEELEEWAKSALDALQLGVKVMPWERLGQWEGVRLVLETYPIPDENHGYTQQPMLEEPTN